MVNPEVRAILVNAVALAGIVLILLALPKVPVTGPDEVEAVEVRLEPSPKIDGLPEECRQDAARVTSRDPASIRGLVAAFLRAERTTEHMCGTSGVVTFHKRDGTKTTAAILPGHDTAYYEYRYGDTINRVARAELLRALQQLG